MNRKHFIQTTGLSLAALISSNFLLAGGPPAALINFPDGVSAILDGELVQLTGRDNQTWTYKNLQVLVKKNADSTGISLHAPGHQLSLVTLSWKKTNPPAAVLNDHWERTYGDVLWHAPQATEILPWYFMEHNGKNTAGFGVKTGAAAFCAWQLEDTHLRLALDTRTGGNGVQLGDRQLQAAEIVTIKSTAGETPFAATRRFTKMMCAKVRMPAQPVYGINDWYFTYGNNSEKLILKHTEMMAPMAGGLLNRPFSVIDAGWFINPPSAPNDCCWGDRMDTPNTARFTDMSSTAEKIKKAGMRPAIWTRPLCGSYKDPASLLLPLVKGRQQNRPVLDPSIPENLERVKHYFKTYTDWGYEMVKFDFTSFDILGKWGFEMMKDGAMTSPGWVMQDLSKTNAEIILTLYKTIREAAGSTYIIGCNTISHLSAGLFELNRIGDDTSGKEWERTLKMGVNTLAFRAAQHGHFYAADADCVGLTTQVAWDKNRLWMELLAKSGTPLFISAQPEAIGTEQKAAIKKAFQLASMKLPVAEPLDWIQHAFPKKWKLNGEIVNFNWD